MTVARCFIIGAFGLFLTTGLSAQDIRPTSVRHDAIVPTNIGVPSRWTCDDDQSSPHGATSGGGWLSRKKAGSSWDLRFSDDRKQLAATYLSFDDRGRPLWLQTEWAPIDEDRKEWRAALYRHGIADSMRLPHRQVGAVSLRLIDGQSKIAIRWGVDGERAVVEEECLHGAPDQPSSVRWRVQGSAAIEVLQTPASGAYPERWTALSFDATGQPVWTTGASTGHQIQMHYLRSTYNGLLAETRCTEQSCIDSRPAGQLRGQLSGTRNPNIAVDLNFINAAAGQALAVQFPPAGQAEAIRSDLTVSAWTIPADGRCQAAPGQDSCTVRVLWSANQSTSLLLYRATNFNGNNYWFWEPQVHGTTGDYPVTVRVGYPESIHIGGYSWCSWGFAGFCLNGDGWGTTLYAAPNNTTPPQYNVGIGVASQCAIGGPPGGAGDSIGIPGRWQNSDRPRTAWDLYFNNSVAGSAPTSMSLIWQTFDANGHPTWLIAPSMEIGLMQQGSETVATARGVLHRDNRSNFSGEIFKTIVGEVSLAFVAGDPSRARIRWISQESLALDPTKPYHEECISLVTTQEVRANQAYTGHWREIYNNNYPINFHFPSIDGVTHQEVLTLGGFDSAGYPRWAQADNPTPTTGNITSQLYWYPSRYSQGIPTSAPNITPAPPPAAIGTVTRSFNHPTYPATRAYLSYFAQRHSNPGFTWESYPREIRKQNRQHEILTSRRRCENACTISVSWATDAASAAVYKRTAGNAQMELVASGGIGSLTQSLSGGVFSYILMADNVILAQSADVVVGGGTAQPGLTLQANPSVGLIAPAQTTLSGTLTNAATATMVHVERVDTQTSVCVSAVSNAGFSCVWQGIATGSYDLRAKTVVNGNNLFSEVLSLTVTNPAPPPVATIPDDPEFASYSEQLDYRGSSGLVGSVDGEASVNGGSASYSIPIKLPPGRRGLLPAISVNYGSRGGNGVLGMGFSVSGTMGISRCAATVAVDGIAGSVRFGGGDRLCLDGQRLISISGQYGLAGTEYRTEIDSHVKIVQRGGNLASDAAVWFEAWTKSGERLWFGSIEGRSGKVKPVGAPGAATMSWLIERRADLYGNSVDYFYEVASSAENLINRIHYTGNHLAQPAVLGDRVVRFNYIARSDLANSFQSGAKFSQTRLLKSIHIEVPGRPTSRYEFIATPSEYSGKSLLRSVQWCGSLAGDCVPATQLQWNERAPNMEFRRVDLSGLPAPTGPITDQVPARLIPIGDIDGDGTRELLYYVRIQEQMRRYLVFVGADRIIKGHVHLEPFAETILGAGFVLTGGDVESAADINGDGRADLLFCKASTGECKALGWAGQPANATPMATQFVSTVVTIPGIAQLLATSGVGPRWMDLNNDGKLDLAVTQSIGETARLWVAYRIQESASQVVLGSLTQVADQLRGMQLVDANGDGVIDFQLDRLFAGGVWSPMGLGRGTIVNGQWNVVASSCESLFSESEPNYFVHIQQFCAVGPSGFPGPERIDVNGDDLADLVYQNVGGWFLRLNNGSTAGALYGDAIPIQGQPGRGVGDPGTSPPAQLLTVDIDSDGREELIRPYAFALRRCNLGVFQDAIGGNPQHPFWGYGCPDLFELPGASGLSKVNGLPVRTWGSDLNQSIDDRYISDSSLYRWEALLIREESDGWHISADRRRPLIGPRSPGVDPQNGTPVDFYGDGLADWLNVNHCRVRYSTPNNISPRPPVPECIVLSSANPADNAPDRLPNGELTAPLAQQFVLFMSLNLGVDGTATARGATPIETLKSITEGLGRRAEWDYASLSSSAGRSAGDLPLYRVPARDSGLGYVDDRHLYFASSMPVVSEFRTSNGIGGLNTQRYGYEEAMFNTQGRGFTGFRKIYVEDLGDGSDDQSLRTVQIFEQKFPLISRLVCEATQRVQDPVAELNCSSGRTISSKSAEYQCNGGSCTAVAAAPVRVDVQRSLVVRRELKFVSNVRGLVSITEELPLYDGFGNLTNGSIFTRDYDGNAQDAEPPRLLRAHTTTTTNRIAAPDLANWWVNKLESSTVAVSQTYGPAHPNVPGAPTRRLTTLYAYTEDGRRSIRCEATAAGIVSPGSTCDSVNAERRTTRAFDNYGNEKTLTTTARDENAARVVTADYTLSQGYFANVVEDALGGRREQQVDPRFGVPFKLVDPNGLETLQELDALGRVIRVVPPAREGARAAVPSVTVYERCSALPSCPANAVVAVVSSAFRSGQSVVYQDVLGRTLRTAVSTLTSTYKQSYATLPLSSMSVTDVAYDARGRVAIQFEPGFGQGNFDARTDLDYDALGRVVLKRQHFRRVDGQVIGGMTERRTEYQHQGTATAIRVCQSVAAACPLTGANPDGSSILTMQRVFDSAGKLLSTTDAKGKQTRFGFDGAGQPIWIRDVRGLEITAQYDDFGRKTSVSDPSRGTWQFIYNGYDELKTQTDARGRQLALRYDTLARLIERQWEDPARGSLDPVQYTESTQYENVSSTEYGTVKSVTRVGIAGVNVSERYEQAFDYDALNRVEEIRTTLQVPGAAPQVFTQRSHHDAGSGRVKQSVYPAPNGGGASVQLYHLYNEAGMLVREGFVADYLVGAAAHQSPALRTITAMNGRGTITGENFGDRGNGLTDWRTNAVYDTSGWLLGQCVNQSGVCSEVIPEGASVEMPLNQRYRYDVYGNLLQQFHTGAWMAGSAVQGGGIGREVYVYDELHRLTGATRTGASGVSVPVNYRYDDIGNLRNKSDYSVDASAGEGYIYQSLTHRLEQVLLKDGRMAGYLYDANGNTTRRTITNSSGKSDVTAIEYDGFNLPRRITRNTGTTADFFDGPGGRYWQRLTVGSVVRDTAMLGKVYERELINGAVNIERYYLTAGILLTVENGVRKLSYLHQDRLGSPVSISEKELPADGRLGTAAVVIKEHRGFDAYGKALDGLWATSNQGLLTLGLNQPMNLGRRNQRGFTGHEHLDEFELIHMNGRAYDYNLGRFYGVDPFVQFPGNSQSLNPYSYLMNNPLAGTDPTGYLGCAASRIEEVCATTPAGYGGHEGTPVAGSKGDKGAWIEISLKYTNGAGEVKERRAILYLSGSELQQIASRDVIEVNGVEDSDGNLTEVEFKLGPKPETIENQVIGMTQGGPVWFRNQAYYDKRDAARLVRGESYFALLKDGDRAPWDHSIDPVYPELELAGSASLARAGFRAALGAGGAGLRTVLGRACVTCRCFAAGTLVLTEDGLRAIEKIQAGDVVASRDEETGELTWQPVLEVYVNLHRDVIEMSFRGPSQIVEKLVVTHEHPFHTRDGRWVPAGELRIGDEVMTRDGSWLALQQVVDIPDNVSTHNFMVADDHNYFVGRSGLWVHNACCGSMALGLREHLDEFSRTNGASTLRDLEGTWLPSNLRFALHYHMQRADRILFNLEGFDFNRFRVYLNNPVFSDGNITNWELRKILGNQNLRQKTTFMNGEIPDDLW